MFADPELKIKVPPPIQHSTAVRTILPLLLTPIEEPYIITGAGDIIRVYDVSSLEEPELVGEVDAHWHDVTAIRLWLRQHDGDGPIEPWVISVSLDGTIRKWKFQGTVLVHSCRRLSLFGMTVFLPAFHQIYYSQTLFHLEMFGPKELRQVRRQKIRDLR